MLRDTASYVWALVRANLAGAWARPLMALAMAVMMCANNLLFFVTFAVYFANFRSVSGWAREDVALLVGISCWSFGLAIVMFDGMREIALRVADGTLDVYLGRPRHPLPAILLSRSMPSGLGDMTSALVFWLVLGNRGLADLPLLLLVGTTASVTIVATVTLFQCLAFWLPRGSVIAEELFQMFLTVALNPQHVYGLPVKFLLLTVFPAGFVSFVPVLAVRSADPLLVLACAGAALVYATIAWFVFEHGIGRYSSGNRIIELR